MHDCFLTPAPGEGVRGVLRAKQGRAGQRAGAAACGSAAAWPRTLAAKLGLVHTVYAIACARATAASAEVRRVIVIKQVRPAWMCREDVCNHGRQTHRSQWRRSHCMSRMKPSACASGRWAWLAWREPLSASGSEAALVWLPAQAQGARRHGEASPAACARAETSWGEQRRRTRQAWRARRRQAGRPLSASMLHFPPWTGLTSSTWAPPRPPTVMKATSSRIKKAASARFPFALSERGLSEMATIVTNEGTPPRADLMPRAVQTRPKDPSHHKAW